MTASHAALNMSRASDLLKKSMRRLSSGQRIVNPSDDAGGLAVGMKLQSQLRRTAATKLNIQNGVSFLQMQDGAMKVAGEILDRMAELKSFFNDVSKNALDRENYNYEFRELQRQLVELQASKFNGVSLFATVEPDNNPLKIITTEDGLTGKVELNRTGLFENLKSKWGADGKLNSGSQGSYRQLVGEFTNDGGLNDADPGQTSRAYASGEVVYKNGPTETESGYFMALTNVTAGTKIEDSGKSTSKWIRLADKGGKGFAEAFPGSEEYNHGNIKYSTSGERVAYLKGDVVKVPAHWGSPGSYLYLKANTDVPRGLTLEQLFSGGYVGENGYMDYVGQDRSNGATVSDKPTTDYVRTNSNLPEPSLYATNNDAALMGSIMDFHAANGFTPSAVKNGNAIYTPSHDWGLERWNNQLSFKEGDIVVSIAANNTASVMEFNSLVQGNWAGKSYAANSYVYNDGVWHRAESAAVSTDVPANPAATSAFSGATAYSAGDRINNGNDIILVAADEMRGTFDAEKTYASGDHVFSSGQWYTLANNHHGGWTSAQTIAANETVEFNGRIYRATAANTATDPVSDIAANGAGTNWTDLGVANDAASFGAAAVTAAVTADAANNAPATFFSRSPWQRFDNAGADQGDPTTALGGSTIGVVDKTSEYIDVTNTGNWTKSHYGELSGKTVNVSYTRGDNIFYQGKHYVYTSHLDSHDPIYVSPTNDGYTEFEDLLRLGAVRELPMYVDTKGGGGGAGLQEGVYYRPDQDLEYVDRLPNSGTVRTNSIKRHTDAPLPPGDDIYNSADDQFYGGLNAGNDGIFGTMDDFYATTSDPNIASSGAHVDADSDNNKDLLDESNKLEHFSVADFVDFIQSLANFRAVNGGTMSRLGYAEDILEENVINLEAATGRIMDADMAAESTKLARQNVLVQAGAAMVTQANNMANVVLSLLQ